MNPRNAAIVLLIAAGAISFLVSFVWGFQIYWGNPDMTRQRLFLDFWREYGVIWALILAGVGSVRAAFWLDDHR